MAIPMARWVLPGPGLPRKMIVLLAVMNWQVLQSLMILLSIEDWKEKSKSSIHF